MISADLARQDTRRGIAVLQRYGYAVASGLLFAAPCLEPRLFFFGWVAFVPLLFALQGQSLRTSYLLGAVQGFAFWSVTTYWVPEFVTLFKGYPPPYDFLVALGFWVYCAQAFGLIAFTVQWLRRNTRVPDILTLPIVFVAVFTAFPNVFYFRMGEGQSGFVLALQGADITGAHGVDFVMALTSVLVYRILRGGWRGPERRVLALATAVLGLWFAYGAYALWHWDQAIAGWETKRIGIVQPNEAVSLDIPPPAKGYSRGYPPEMEATERLASQGADLVVWPEARYKGYFDYRIVRGAYQERIAAAGTNLLFHDLERETVGDRTAHYNSAVLLDSSGEQRGVYRKVKLMPFGEYLPILDEVDFVRRLVESYFGDFFREIAPGEGHQILSAGGMRIVPKICFESAFPGFIGEVIGDDGAGKVLVLLSQDSWFGRNREPFQHFWASSLRAVENRVPLVHVINGGPSGIVLPSGRVGFRTTPFVRSETVVDMPYSPQSGGSFYSRHPGIFLDAVYLLFFGALLTGVMRAVVVPRLSARGERAKEIGE